MNKIFPRLATFTFALVSVTLIGTVSKPSVAEQSNISCNVNASTLSIDLGLGQQMTINPEFFDSEAEAIEQCHEAIGILESRDGGEPFLVAQTLESGDSVICLRSNDLAGCDEDGAANLFALKKDVNPQEALLEMLGKEDENPPRTLPIMYIRMERYNNSK